MPQAVFGDGPWGRVPYYPVNRQGDEESETKAQPGKAGEIARWNNHKFKVEKSAIHGFIGLQIKGATEIEDKVGSEQKFVSRKNSKPTEISLTAILNAALGCDVQKEAMQFVAEAYAGSKDWFYIGKSKLATYKLMLTDATVKEIVISPKGRWISAQVALTLKQCTQKNGSTEGVVEKSGSDDHGDSSGGGGGGGGGGSKKRSAKGGTNRSSYDPTRTEGKSGHTSIPKRFSEEERTRTAQEEIDKRKQQAQQSAGTGDGSRRGRISGYTQ